jgi:hypothetical protein
VIAQLFERSILVLTDSRPQHLLVAGQEARRVPPAVRARGDVLPAAVQVERLIDERGADAEEFGHLADGAVVAQGGG